MHAIDPGPLGNKLLASLPHRELQLLLPHLVAVQFPQGAVLAAAGDEVDQVYFPLSGMISMVVVMRDGKAVETATVGREGVVGAMSGIGLHISRVRAIAQLPVSAGRIASTELRRATAVSRPITDLCIRYNEVLLTQARVTAACNALASGAWARSNPAEPGAGRIRVAFLSEPRDDQTEPPAEAPAGTPIPQGNTVFDGRWIFTSAGCTRTGSLLATIRRGKIIVRGGSGTVSPDGTLHSVGAGGGMTLTAVGTLSGGTGAGTFNRSDGCVGSWIAIKR